MSDRMKRLADRADERAAGIREQLRWYEMVAFRLRGRRGDGPLEDQTDEHVGRQRRALGVWEAIRARLRRDHGV